MDDRSAGEVERSKLRSPAPAPRPVGERIVHQRRPEQAEDDERTQLHSFGDRRRDDGQSQPGNDQLEDHEEQVRDAVALHPDAMQEDVIEVSYQPVDIGAEGQAVAEDDPLDADEGKCDERQREHGDEVLPPHEPAVEEPHSRSHQHDHSRADEDKRRRAGINHAPASGTPVDRLRR